MDFDAGSQVESANNQRDGIHVEELCMINFFNNPQFSGNSGFTTVSLHNNAGNGISLQNNSQLHMFDQAKILINHNNFGIQADNGSSMTVLNSAIQNNKTDVTMTFASRGTRRTSPTRAVTCPTGC